VRLQAGDDGPGPDHRADRGPGLHSLAPLGYKGNRFVTAISSFFVCRESAARDRIARMPLEASFAWRYTDSYEFMERVQSGMPPLIVCVACNGGVQGKEANPALPETPDQIAESVESAYRAGASMVHIHARDPEDLSTGARSAETWLEVLRKVRQACPEIIVNSTTGGGPGMSMEDRLSCLDAGPELASLNLSPDMSKFRLKERPFPLPHPRPALDVDECVPYTYGMIHQFASAMKKRGIKPELEIYHPGGAWVIRSLIEEGLIEKPYWVQTVMGYQTSSFPTVENVLGILKDLPEGAMWLCSGVGPFQLPMNTLATLMGGHVRVGLE